MAELDGQGAVTAVNTVGANGLLSRHTTNGPGGGSAFYTFDPQGSAAQRLDGSGSVLTSYVLDAYGGRVGTDSGADPFSGFGGQWGYYTDAETGLQLLTHRYYDTGTGRFITRDPIGYSGGLNLYGYTGNNPINLSDPSGFEPAGSFTSLGGYLSEVGGVFQGYGSVLNPAHIARGVANLAQTARADGFGAAGAALGHGVWHGLTDWLTTDDPQRFGQSFGTTLLTVAPLMKGIPNSTAFTIEGPWLSPENVPLLQKTGATLFRVNRGGKQQCRVDIGRLPNNANIPRSLRGRQILHYHRAVEDPASPGQSLPGQGVGRHRPWQNGPGSRF